MSKNYPEKEVNVNDLSGEELGALASDETEPEAPKRIFSRIRCFLRSLPSRWCVFCPLRCF